MISINYKSTVKILVTNLCMLKVVVTKWEWDQMEKMYRYLIKCEREMEHIHATYNSGSFPATYLG